MQVKIKWNWKYCVNLSVLKPNFKLIRYMHTAHAKARKRRFILKKSEPNIAVTFVLLRIFFLYQHANCNYFTGAHTLGFSHCNRFSNRIYSTPVDPTLNRNYATQLQQMCPKNVNPQIAINMDPTTPRTFDNIYYKNLQQGKGLFTSDQILFTDQRSKATVNSFASNSNTFNANFAAAMIKLGRVGVKTARNGKIRADCSVL